MGSGQTSGQRIVVGLDGSPSSRTALAAWAVRQAELIGPSVESVLMTDAGAARGG